MTPPPLPLRPLRSVFALALVASVLGCATTARVLPPPVDVPENADRSGWAQIVIRRGSVPVMSALTSGPRATVRSLRMDDDTRASLLDAQGLARSARAPSGGTPVEGDSRWQRFRGLRGSAMAGWCARGVRVVEAGSEGFAHRALVIDRLLVVGQEPGSGNHYWGAWIEGLVVTREGLRVLPWVPWRDAIDAPRRDHLDVELWDCDLGERPGTMAQR